MSPNNSYPSSSFPSSSTYTRISFPRISWTFHSCRSTKSRMVGHADESIFSTNLIPSGLICTLTRAEYEEEGGFTIVVLSAFSSETLTVSSRREMTLSLFVNMFAGKNVFMVRRFVFPEGRFKIFYGGMQRHLKCFNNKFFERIYCSSTTTSYYYLYKVFL